DSLIDLYPEAQRSARCRLLSSCSTQANTESSRLALDGCYFRPEVARDKGPGRLQNFRRRVSDQPGQSVLLTTSDRAPGPERIHFQLRQVADRCAAPQPTPDVQPRLQVRAVSLLRPDGRPHRRFQSSDRIVIGRVSASLLASPDPQPGERDRTPHLV